MYTASTERDIDLFKVDGHLSTEIGEDEDIVIKGVYRYSIWYNFKYNYPKEQLFSFFSVKGDASFVIYNFMGTDSILLSNTMHREALLRWALREIVEKVKSCGSTKVSIMGSERLLEEAFLEEGFHSISCDNEYKEIITRGLFTVK